jgi:hypothetical protein
MDDEFSNLTPEEIAKYSDPDNWDANPPDLNPDFVWIMSDDRQRAYLTEFGDTQETRDMFKEAFGYDMTI